MVDNELVDFSQDIHWIYGFCCVICIISAALAAGLTVGLLSMDSIRLKIKLAVGTPEEKVAALKIIPIISNHHLLLCTLLFFNALANEALPIFLDALVPSWVAVILSVTLVLICGEIIPSALFTGPSQLQIASKFTGFVKLLEWLFCPIAYPMALLLDRILGKEDEDGYSREEISALVRILNQKNPGNSTHRSNASHVSSNSMLIESSGLVSSTSSSSSPYVLSSTAAVASSSSDPLLTTQEVEMITGVLGLVKKVVADFYTPWHNVNWLSYDQILDQSSLEAIQAVGHSRLLVIRGSFDQRHVLGYLLVKRLIQVNPEKKIPVSSLAPFGHPLVLGLHQSLLEALSLFQSATFSQNSSLSSSGSLSGSSPTPMALVSSHPHLLRESLQLGRCPDRSYAPVGLITLQDVLEAMLTTSRNPHLEWTSLTHANPQEASKNLREISRRSSESSLASLSSNETALSHHLSRSLESISAVMDEGLMEQMAASMASTNNSRVCPDPLASNVASKPSTLAPFYSFEMTRDRSMSSSSSSAAAAAAAAAPTTTASFSSSKSPSYDSNPSGTSSSFGLSQEKAPLSSLLPTNGEIMDLFRGRKRRFSGVDSEHGYAPLLTDESIREFGDHS